MAVVTPDVSTRLKPDFIPVVQVIYRDMCNLRAGEQVLILTDARTPDHISGVFHGVATMLGASAVTLEANIAAGGPAYQPGTAWPEMIAAAAQKADLIIDLVVGYAPCITAAIAKGARVLCPADGISGPITDDMLIRTIRDTDIFAIRKTALRVADHFTRASTCTLISGDGDKLAIDIRDVQGAPHDGFLWDREQERFCCSYTGLPPAQPGVMLPRGRANGTLTVDGTVLWHQIYHESPRDPLSLDFVDGKIVAIRGDRYLSNRLRLWLETLKDEGAWEGPNHVNIGVNPNAMMTQSQEFERVLGAVTCGLGDLSTGTCLYAPESKLAPSKASVHWDCTVLHPTVLLDDEIILANGRLFPGSSSER